MLDQAPLSNAKEARGMSEKSDEKCLNPTTCPLIMKRENIKEEDSWKKCVT